MTEEKKVASEGSLKFSKFLRNKALSLAEIESDFKMEVSDCDAGDREANQHLSAIILFGESCRIGIKIHFKYSDAKAFAARKFKILSEEVDENDAMELLKEHVNILAGHVRTELEKVGILVGHGLPFVVQGYHEVFFDKDVNKSCSGTFRVGNDQMAMLYSYDLTSLSEDLENKLRTIDQALDHTKKGAFEIL